MSEVEVSMQKVKMALEAAEEWAQETKALSGSMERLAAHLAVVYLKGYLGVE